MDDFYVACQEKIQNATDSVVAITELAANSLRDLPQVQICQYAEQTATLLSVVFQAANGSPQDLISQFRQIRQHLEETLNYMEQIMSAKKEFPSSRQQDGCWW